MNVSVTMSPATAKVVLLIALRLEDTQCHETLPLSISKVPLAWCECCQCEVQYELSFTTQVLLQTSNCETGLPCTVSTVLSSNMGIH